MKYNYTVELLWFLLSFAWKDINLRILKFPGAQDIIFTLEEHVTTSLYCSKPYFILTCK